MRASASPGSITVGVFDSGVGGLSVLPALRRRLPDARLLYLADSGHAPYGERSDEWLQARCLQIADFLKAQGAQLLVMACNTATAAAAETLRQRYPSWPIVGMEPGIKPAIAQSPSGRVGVMATTATLRSERYARLLAAHGTGAHVLAQACTGLALAIEQGDTGQIASMVDRYTQPLRDACIDTLVLGCTHYAFARPWISAAVGPDVAIIDTADAVARRTADLAQDLKSQRGAGTRQVACDDARDGFHEPSTEPASESAWTSGNASHLESFAQRWLGWALKVHAFNAAPPKALAS